MVADLKRKSSVKKSYNKKNEKILQAKAEKDSSNVSVITKTTTPKVIIQSENVRDNEKVLSKSYDKHLILKLVCFVIMCVILLMTFFLSLKTYNAVNELSDFVHWRIHH